MSEQADYCPLSVTTSVLADRWTPLILRELLQGSTRFNAIAGALPAMSRTLLSQRLRQLERRGVIASRPNRHGRGSEYHLTPAGRGLRPVLNAMADWAVRWQFDDPDDVPPAESRLMLQLERSAVEESLPEGRVVLELRFTDVPSTRWMMLDRGRASACHLHPGVDADVVLRGTSSDFADVIQGSMRWQAALRDQRIVASGPSFLVRSIPVWFDPARRGLPELAAG